MKSNILFILLVYCQMAFGQTHSEKVILNQNENYVNIVSKSSSGLTLEINTGNFNKTPVSIDGNNFYSISLENESSIREKGNPELPKIVRSIAIPGTSGFKANITKSEYTDFDLPIIPSKGILSRIVNPADIPYTFSSIYSRNEFFPEERLSFGEPYLIRSVRGSAISIFPFAYNPVSKKLRVYTKLIIEISFEGTNLVNSNSNVSAKKNRTFEQIYKNQFINYNYQPNFKSSSGVDENGRILIIAYDSFVEEMQPFVDHKNCIGLPTQIVKISTVGSTFDQVYNYIKNNYNIDNNLAFVLLVGDDVQIPTKMLSNGASDASYSLLTNGDNYPDIIVGRFSAETEAQVTTMVNRSIAYEKMVDQPWFHNGIGIASTLSPGDDGESDWSHLRNIRTSLLGYNYTSISELYDGSQGGADASGNPTASMLSAAVNSGVSIINFTGHGGPNSWGTTGFDISNVNSLTNDNKLPFIFSTACLVGNFTNHFCFAESWLRAKNSSTGNPTGAIAFYGASGTQTSFPTMEAQDKFNSLLVSDSYMSFGALCYNASCRMMDVYGNDGVANFLTWNIFGDPSINLKRPSISGSNIVCSSGATFTINNFPSDASVSWNGGPYLSLSSQSGNSATFTVIGNGTSPVSAIIYPVNPGSCQINLTKAVWVGKPIFTSSVNGPSQLTPGWAGGYSISPATGATSYSWQIPSGCYYNYCWNIMSGQGTTAITAQAGAIGSGAIQCSASNGCGTDSRYMYITVQDPQAPCNPLTLSISPNPSVGGNVVIDVIKPPCDPTLLSSEPATLSVIDNMGTVVYSKKHTGNKMEISGLHLIKGVYHVVYTRDNKKIEKSMIVQ